MTGRRIELLSFLRAVRWTAGGAIIRKAATGEDATNELSYLILAVIEEMRLLQPGSMVQISKKNPGASAKTNVENN